MNRFTLEEIWGTLSYPATVLVDAAVRGADGFFKDKGSVPSSVLAMPEEGNPRIYDIRHTNIHEKHVAWAFIRMLRATHPCVVLVAESWVVELKGNQKWEDCPLPPSQHPDHIEVIMISVWDCGRHLILQADIHRNPDKLGDWTVGIDTMFPNPKDKETKMDGELNRGTNYQQNNN